MDTCTCSMALPLVDLATDGLTSVEVVRDVPMDAVARINDAPAGLLGGLEQGAGRWAVRDGGRLAAALVTTEHDGDCHVSLVATLPEARRRGLASALLAAAEVLAREAGMRGIRVDTPVDNAPARALYLARGYAPGDRMPRYYGDDTDGIAYSVFFDA